MLKIIPILFLMMTGAALADDAAPAQPVPTPVTTSTAGAFLIIHANPADITIGMQTSAACETEVARIAKNFKASCVHMDNR